MVTEQRWGSEELLRLPVRDLVSLYRDLPFGGRPDWPQASEESEIAMREADDRLERLLELVQKGDMSAPVVADFVRDSYQRAMKSDQEATETLESISLILQGKAWSAQGPYWQQQIHQQLKMDLPVDDELAAQARAAGEKALKLYLAQGIQAGVIMNGDMLATVINHLLVCGYQSETKELVESIQGRGKGKQTGTVMSGAN